jgi:short-subunit dehydrogenase
MAVQLRDQVIVITGASSGFGEAIARACAQRGARLALVARSADRLAQLAEELGGAERALVVPADITDDVAVAAMAERILGHYGHVDVLVNNAGFGVLDRVADARLADLQAMMDVNLYGALRCTSAFLPSMLQRRSGQIVTMASIAGLISFENLGFYAATKHAIVGAFQALTVELGGSGVRCVLICPGVALTNFMQRAEVGKYPRVTRLIPWLTSEQVAAATVRAIERRREGRVVVPWQARPLVLATQLAPGLTRLVMRILH